MHFLLGMPRTLRKTRISSQDAGLTETLTVGQSASSLEHCGLQQQHNKVSEQRTRHKAVVRQAEDISPNFPRHLCLYNAHVLSLFFPSAGIR